MKPHQIRLVGISLTILLCITLGAVWIKDAVAQPPTTTGDFQPTYTPRQAAERIALAQEQEQQRRVEQGAVDANQLPYVPTVYFPATGHHLSNRSGFLDFWRANGQVMVFGYPITEEIIEDGKLVQYFERARFEFHPELMGTPWQVQLGLIGTELLQGGHPGIADPLNGQRYFAETGHTLSWNFNYYWHRRGQERIFGFPITEPFVENGREVQYFERAKFVHFPENTPYYGTGYELHSLYDVQLSDVGRQLAQARGVDISPVEQLPGAPEWSASLWQRHIDVNLSAQWLTAYEGGLLVFDAPITTGRPGFDTPAGSYAIYDKLTMQTMQGSAQGETWHVPNVPWVMYVVGGVAMHGTYWHNMFGSGARLSHGCINLRIDDAQWLYEWSNIGTTVNIHY
jgi:hypothetical protein